MRSHEIAAEVRAEIGRLEKVLELLGEGDAPRRGRKKRGTMSAEARAKIAAAQKKRWAKQKKAE